MSVFDLADEMEIYCVENVDIPVMFSSNVLKSTKLTFTQCTAVRVIHEGRLGFSYSIGEKGEDVNIARKAVRISKYGEPAAFEFPAEKAPRNVQIYDNAVADLDMSTLVERGTHVRDRILHGNPDIKCDIMVRKNVTHTVLENSEGFCGEFQKSVHGVAIKAALYRGTMLEFTTSTMKCTADLDFETLLTRVQDAMQFEQVSTIEQGAMPVILAPRALSEFLEPLKLAVNGKVLMQGISRFQGKVGADVADETISVADDGTLPHMIGTLPYDGEGVPTQHTTLIKNGQMRAYLFDLQTAGQKDTESTGNGLRTFNTTPTPTLTNVVMEKGTASLASLVEEIDRGVLVENVMGTQQSNLFSGDMALNVVFGRKIEEGKLTHAVKGGTIRANTFAALNAVMGVSYEREEMGNAVLPYVAFTSLKIS